MMRAFHLALLISCVATGLHAQDIALGEKTTLVFASADRAKAFLSTPDDFVKRLSPFDRSARLKTDQTIDQSTYLKFAGDQALDWSAEERAGVATAVDSVRQKLLDLKLNLPKEILMIKTTGLEEGGAAYTRGTAIVLPNSRVTGAMRSMPSLFVHELFHVLSRHDKELREKLYAVIGFQPCGELEFPASIRDRKLTNPDGPTNNHCIQVKLEDQAVWAIPILYSKSEKYDVARGGEFFNYLTFQLLVIQTPPNQAGASQPLMKDGMPVFLDPRSASGYMDQIGRNTNYIIHPDEVLADNFVILVVGGNQPASPELLEKLRGQFGQ